MNQHTALAQKTIAISRADYEALTTKIEDLEDRLALARSGKEESFPSEVLDRLLDGENPVRVFRTYRKIKQNALAATCGISKGYLSQIESGAKEGSLSVYRKLADVLDLDIDDLI
ncbi:MAG: transcriptional regulator [Rhodospirillaceae bacterium]|nr:MAG: transcriptional regulator [Rhodospirillaceae bacterium]